MYGENKKIPKNKSKSLGGTPVGNLVKVIFPQIQDCQNRNWQ
jgi:hypothetical protein